MLSEAERENTKLVLIELFGLCDKRSSSYGNILFCSAMTRAFDGLIAALSHSGEYS